MNRFGARGRPGGWLGGILLPTAFFAVVFSLFLYGLGTLDRAAGAEELRAAEQAIRRAAVHCYAVEGRYPPSLGYLEDHYGIRVDSRRYLVHYQPVAANLMPDILVIPLGGQSSPDGQAFLD